MLLLLLLHVVELGRNQCSALHRWESFRTLRSCREAAEVIRHCVPKSWRKAARRGDRRSHLRMPVCRSDICSQFASPPDISEVRHHTAVGEQRCISSQQ